MFDVSQRREAAVTLGKWTMGLLSQNCTEIHKSKQASAKDKFQGKLAVSRLFSMKTT